MGEGLLTLGLDLGPNSIGWALVDEAGEKLVAAGVRVFPEGVDRDKQGGEVAKNEARRTKRGSRRQIARRSRRRRRLREALQRAGLLPENLGAINAVDPYLLRRRGLDEKLGLHELGAALYHVGQRRGFKSNRKTDRGKEEGVVYEGINELKAKIAEANCRTLGEYLASMRGDQHVRVRGKYLLRKTLEDEFDLLWEKQARHYPQVLTETLRTEVRDAIFFQRPLHPATALIGRCELEPREARCPVAHRHAQRYRMLQELNNLLVIDALGEERALSRDERAKALKLLEQKEKVGFDELRSKLGLLDSHGFNLERGERGYLWGHRTDHALRGKGLFGKKWDGLEEGERDRIVELLIEAEDPEKLKALAQAEWGLSEEQAGKLAGLSLQKGYMYLSLKAIDKLLPHMDAGLPLTSASGPSAMERAGYLRPDQKPAQALDALPQPPELRNPIVQRALHEVRKVVNAILREYGKPGAIHVELAREARGSLKQREDRTAEMRKRERERAEIIERLKSEFGIAQPSRSDVERYRLWQDFKETCPYTGRAISRAQLFGRDVDVDHILPYSRSLDNSYANKVICFQSANAEKSNRTPYEWLGGDASRYETMLQRVGHLWKLGQRGKQKKFSQKTLELDDFIARQLNDTQYISREVTKYLRTLGTDVVCTKGQATADLRRQLGLERVLSDGERAVKNREDHRHHAVDALVIGLTNRSRLQRLAHARGGEAMPPPWPNFREDVERTIKAINVSHRVERKVAGALHEETIYGPTSKGKLNSKLERPWAKGWIEESGVVVYRKRLEDLTAAMVPQIRDETIRELISDRVKRFGIEPGSDQSIPKEVWKEALQMPSGRPIRKVRIVKSDLTIQAIRGGSAWVKPGSVHHVCIFEVRDLRGKIKREPVFVSMMEAARRVRDGEPLIKREHPRNSEAKFVMSLSRGELVLGTFKGKERLVRFRTCASTQGQLYFVEHTDARPDKTAMKFAATANSLKARKVTVDPLGRIRWAND